jgi:exonuclease SbcD
MSMRILHLADLHLGTELYGHYDAATGSSTRLADFTRMLDLVVDRAIAERVDLFLFAGDAYKTRDPSPTQQRELALRLRRLLDAQIPVFLLTGNHDMPNAVARATSLDIFGALYPIGFNVASKPAAYRIETRSGPLQIIAIPWITRSAFFAKDENKNLPPDELHQLLLDRLERSIDYNLEQLQDDPGTPAILTLHGTVQGAIYSIERSTMLSQDLLIPKSVICRPRFSYIALGHIHKYQVIHQQPLAVYAGSPERIDFGEEHDRKGFVLVDLDRDGATHQFVELPTRPFVTVDIRAEDEDPTAAVLAAVRGRDFAGAIVRLRIHLTPANQGRVREAEIRQALRDASWIAFRPEVDRAWREADRGRAYNTAMLPRQALEIYIERERPQETAERKALLLQAGSRLIQETLGGSDA